jgi:hypothetical protein
MRSMRLIPPIVVYALEELLVIAHLWSSVHNGALNMYSNVEMAAIHMEDCMYWYS